MEAAAKDIAARRPDLERLMTRGKNLPDTILNWRRKLEEAQSGDFLWKFSRHMLDTEETLRSWCTGDRMAPTCLHLARAYSALTQRGREFADLTPHFWSGLLVVDSR